MGSHLDKKALLSWLDPSTTGVHAEISRQIRSGVFDVTSNGDAIQSVMSERQRQDAKWGEQNHEPQFWVGILGEEFGELCQAINETVFNNGPTEKEKGGYANMRAEAVQVAAVAVSFIEYLDRRYGQ